MPVRVHAKALLERLLAVRLEVHKVRHFGEGGVTSREHRRVLIGQEVYDTLRENAAVVVKAFAVFVASSARRGPPPALFLLFVLFVFLFFLLVVISAAADGAQPEFGDGCPRVEGRAAGGQCLPLR